MHGMSTTSLTGDPITDAVIPPAMRLVWAVREGNADAIAAAIADACTVAGEHGMGALVVVLAAMVPDDMGPAGLLGWLHDRDEYLRLRHAGVGAYAAATLAADWARNTTAKKASGE